MSLSTIETERTKFIENTQNTVIAYSDGTTRLCLTIKTERKQNFRAIPGHAGKSKISKPARTRALMEKIGQAPVVLNREIPGFAVNRIQYAILNECWRLVEDGVMNVKDVDTVMSHGLGPRYAFIGPLEVAHLNAEGMENYCERYWQSIHSVSNTFGPVPKMTPDNVVNTTIHPQLCDMVPMEKMIERRKWRDDSLARLAKLKKERAKKE
ncbi:lambda-crystallin homolog [Lineus longissimus]|uniref:lambda-crystallin homolog n=1 Tax=Lineus longissimus TaxID=88925 RepID=UPI00315D7700